MWARFWGTVEELLGKAFAWGVTIALLAGGPWFIAANVLKEELIQPLAIFAAVQGRPMGHWLYVLLVVASPLLLVPSVIGWFFMNEHAGAEPLPPRDDPGWLKALGVKVLRQATVPCAYAGLIAFYVALLAFFLNTAVVAPIGFFARVFGHPLSEDAHAGVLVGVTLATLAAMVWGFIRLANASVRKREEEKAARAKEAASPRPDPTTLKDSADWKRQWPAPPVHPALRPQPPPRPLPFPRFERRSDVLHLGDPAPPERVRALAEARKREGIRDWPEPEPLGPGLSEAQWLTLNDARALLEHAIPRIPVRHTCLVLSQLSEEAWTGWNRLAPEDWRPGWCLTTLRAWCLGEASLERLDAARSAALRALRRLPTGADRFRAHAAIRTIACASLYAGYDEIGDPSLGPALTLLEYLMLLRRTSDATLRATELAAEVREDLDRAEGTPLTSAQAELAQADLERQEDACDRRVSAQLAERLREWIPYPWGRSEFWHRQGQRVYAGSAILELDGFRIARSGPSPTAVRLRSALRS